MNLPTKDTSVLNLIDILYLHTLMIHLKLSRRII